MKKKSLVILVLIMVLAITAVFIGAYYFLTPRRIIDEAVESMRSEGLKGIKPYLTDELEDKVDDILFVMDLPVTRFILDKADDVGLTDVVIHNVEKIDWSVEDVRVGLKAAEIELAYQYGDYSGSAELTMKIQDNKWKIDSIDFPLLDSLFSLKSTITGR